jgi:hypothetical protein
MTKAAWKKGCTGIRWIRTSIAASRERARGFDRSPK